MAEINVEELVLQAITEAREKSYSPYSRFKVGAVVASKKGNFIGANIENASYPCCTCAERIALYNAYMNGCIKEDLEALVVVADIDVPCSPCGNCRQVISELFPSDAPIYMANLKGDVVKTTIKELLPFAFSEDSLKWNLGL